MDFQGIKRKYPILFLGAGLIPDRIQNCILSALKENDLSSTRSSKLTLSEFFVFAHPKFIDDLTNYYSEHALKAQRPEVKSLFPVWIINGANLGPAKESGFQHFSVRLSNNEDEIRSKIIHCIETYRQNIFERHILKYVSANTQIKKSNMDLDLFRLVHAICCFLNLSPQDHIKTMARLSEKVETEHFSNWESSKESADWIIGSCHLALKSADSSTQFKDQHRLLSKNLPFKARSDIRDAIENCLLHFWRQENAS